MLNPEAAGRNWKQQFHEETYEQCLFISAVVHEQGHMDMEMIKLTSLAREMSTAIQTNSVSENSFSAVELKCDY